MKNKLYGRKAKYEETRRAFPHEVFNFLKTHPHDSSSLDIVYLYEHSNSNQQTKFLQDIVASYICVEIVEKVVSYLDDDGYNEISREQTKIYYAKYDIPSSTKKELQDACARLKAKNTPAYNTDEYRKAEAQNNNDRKLRDLF